MTRRQGKPVKDPAPNGMREQVALAASQAWQEPTWVIWLGRSYRCRITFDVPGLRANGTVRGEHRVRWFLARLPWGVAMVLGYTVTTACSLLWIAIKALPDALLNSAGGVVGGGTPLNWRLGWLRRTTVGARGPGAGSVGAGHALQRKRGHLWLVFSAHGTAFTAVDHGHQEVLWAQHNAGRPVFVLDRMQVCWPDESTITIRPSGPVRQLLRPYSAAQPHNWPPA